MLQIVATHSHAGQPTISMIIICLCYRRRMKRALTITYSLFCLSLLSACEQRTPQSDAEVQIQAQDTPSNSGITKELEATEPSSTDSQTDTTNRVLADHLSRINTWIAQDDLTQIKHYVLQHYSALTRSELDAIKQALLSTSTTQANAIDQLALAAELFDDSTSWLAYAQHAERGQYWHEAHAAYLQLSQHEVRPEKQEQALSALVRTSAHLRNELERNADLAGIRLLYQQLVDLHPGFPRFRLELAHASMHHGDHEHARQLYEELRYDPEFGDIAEHALETIDRQSADKAARNDVVIPLEMQGSSMVVEVTLNQRPATLLLDTGASITALSQSTIRSLNLNPTGEQIWLATANGQRQSAIYSLNQITLGQFKLNRVPVAEIELERFDGLLGTDLLNVLAQKYNYRLENNPSRLVFSPKP
jgi:clan AA aspartic protease (TIGR02281 family)